MKKNEFMQIKGLDIKELIVKAKALRNEMANLILDKNMKKLKDVKTVSKKKKELAKILTLVRQKELLTQLESRVESQSFDVAQDDPERSRMGQESSKKTEEQPKVKKKEIVKAEKPKTAVKEKKGEKS